jgi:anti-anti-sigma regulatory factor
MAYHVSVTTLGSEQRYRVVVPDELDGSTARHLGEWIEAARENPGARFELDLSEARWVNPRALRQLVTRHSELRAEHRLEVVGDRVTGASRMAVLPASALLLAEPLLSLCQ